MGLFSSIAVFFVLWWLSFVVVLPFGGKREQEAAGRRLGTDSGAPERPQMGIKLLATTILAAIIFGAFFLYFNVYHLTMFDLTP
jgi:predicted secreted protein